jgi:hypothetical protein
LVEDKSFSRRLKLNRAILGNKYWWLPVDDKGHSNYEPVGRGVESSSSCGRWVGLDTCKNFEGHEGQLLDGKDCSGKVVNRHKHWWCHKSSCPVCFISGWSVRGANHITGRVLKGVELGFGLVEHVIVSVPEEDRNLPESVLRLKCRMALIDCGVLGGGMIFHGYRIGRRLKRGVLVWSPHYHCLGFVLGGFDRCRHCKGGDCRVCGGFMGKAYMLYDKNGYIVDVKDKRESIFGTAWYQLHHSTIKLGVKRFHVVTWFGSCGNRKFESLKVAVKSLCRVCGEEMGRSVYVGKDYIEKRVGRVGYKPVFLTDEFDEDGGSNYIDR